MYYIKIAEEDSNQLIYYCRKCGNENNELTLDNICVSKIHIKRDDQKYKHIINEYTKYDPTLPRTTAVKCPNLNCTEDTESKDETETKESETIPISNKNTIVYLRYDDINMKYIYLCTRCDTSWITNQSG
jgi:DNA-directed RNA polymerase subunit M/transcription elongation factor TFIIS